MERQRADREAREAAERARREAEAQAEAEARKIREVDEEERKKRAEKLRLAEERRRIAEMSARLEEERRREGCTPNPYRCTCACHVTPGICHDTACCGPCTVDRRRALAEEEARKAAEARNKRETCEKLS